MKKLMGLGYNNVDKLEETFVDFNRKEVLALLECIFSSDTPLTDVFLTKRNSCVITKTHNQMPSLAAQEKAESNEVLSLTVFVRKQDIKILCVESEQDFVDLLLIFLALPLESVWELSGSNSKMGCIDNFYKSMRSFIRRMNASPYTCRLPWHYTLHTPLLGVSCPKEINKVTVGSRCYNLHPMYPNYDGITASTTCSSCGLVKKGKTYMILDDLTITPTNSSSTICMMKKWNVNVDDIKEHVINITKTEAIGLLRASIMTSTALTTALASILPKKPKEEKL